MHLDADGTGRQAERRADLVIGKLVVGAHEERGAVDLRQLLERDQGGAELLPDDRALESAFVKVRDLVYQAVVERNRRAPPELVQVEIASDCEEIAFDRREIDALARRPEPDEGLRNEILGERRVARKEEREAVKRLRFRPVELRDVDHRRRSRELAAVERASLSVGGLLIAAAEPRAVGATIAIALRIAGGPTVGADARVVAALPGALALELAAPPGQILEALRRERPSAESAAVAAVEPADRDEDSRDGSRSLSLWERLRKMTPPQKMLLAPKADRFERAILVQDSDPQVLFALLKNPRLGTDEVLRVAKSSFLSFQAAELILKTQPWFANLDVRVALIHNPKLPVPFALRILPTLPESEVRVLARGAATSMQLRQAALRRLQGG